MKESWEENEKENNKKEKEKGRGLNLLASRSGWGVTVSLIIPHHVSATKILAHVRRQRRIRDPHLWNSSVTSMYTLPQLYELWTPTKILKVHTTWNTWIRTFHKVVSPACRSFAGWAVVQFCRTFDCSGARCSGCWFWHWRSCCNYLAVLLTFRPEIATRAAVRAEKILDTFGFWMESAIVSKFEWRHKSTHQLYARYPVTDLLVIEI